MGALSSVVGYELFRRTDMGYIQLKKLKSTIQTNVRKHEGKIKDGQHRRQTKHKTTTQET
jgi:hypothetical protein